MERIMTIRREWITPITAGAFLLSAVTGILIFFHIGTGLNKFGQEQERGQQRVHIF